MIPDFLILSTAVIRNITIMTLQRFFYLANFPLKTVAILINKAITIK